MKTALQESQLENILDANMFTAYIPRDMDIPRFADPRQTALDVGTFRQPGHIHSRYINQVFSCIGYIKRIQNLDHLKYLPVLYEELGRFLLVMEDITYSMDIRTSREIYEAQKRGFEGFFASYHRAVHDHDVQWIGTIRKHQFLYLEKIDMLIETLKARGNVFDCSGHSLYEEILETCRGFADNKAASSTAIDTACRFVANCCAKAALDGQSKVIWSGDMHVLDLLRHLYARPQLYRAFPQVYLRSNYDPMNFAELFPKWQHGKKTGAEA
ncbi:MAG: hypothetical protein PHC90_09645 [Syntrophorhabdaceae bacterium]|nr:hypothetical protein [Syntrophorhabdaceae bacterium]